MGRTKSKFNFRQLIPFATFLIVSLIVLSPQLLNHGMIVGDDCWFHMNRAYEAMMQIKTGHFSYFLDLFSFDRAGRIVTGLYGPLGSYLEGLLLLLVRTWYRWELANSLLVLVIAGLSTYYVARKLDSPKGISLAAGTMYMLSFPFIHWTLGQNFDGFGAMLLPWILLAGYRIFIHKFNWIKLALLVAVIIQVHLMTAFIGICSLLLSLVLSNFKSHRIRLWKDISKSSVLCLFLTVNVWGSLLELKSSNYLVPTVPYSHPLLPGLALNWHMIFQPKTYPLVDEVLFLLLVSIALLIFKNLDSINSFLAIQGFVFMLIYSQYFPWGLILKRHSMVASYIQFPGRFFPLAIAAIVLLVSRLKPHKVALGVLMIVLLFSGFMDLRNDYNQSNSLNLNRAIRSHNITLNHRTSLGDLKAMLHSDNDGRFLETTNNWVPDYMPFKININRSQKYYLSQPNKINQFSIINNKKHIQRTVTGRDTATLRLNAKPHRQLTLPFVKYAHTRLWLNHRVINPKLNTIHAIELRPTQKRNVLQAQYQPSQWYKLLIVLEIITWVTLIISIFWYKVG